MDKNKELQRIWNLGGKEAPSVKELHQKTDEFERSNLKMFVFGAMGMVLSVIIIAIVWYLYQPQMITTKLGLVIVLSGIFMSLISYIGIVPMFTKTSYELSSKQYLQWLIEVKRKKHVLQTTILSIYFILLWVGLILYMLEPSLKMGIVGRIIAYAVVVLWLGINWYVFRPRIIKKQGDKINSLITELERVNEQFS